MKILWPQVLAACVLGGLVGAWAATQCGSGRGGHHGGSSQFQQRLLERFSRKLQLTPEQRTKVSGILAAKAQKMEALRQEVRPKFEELRTSTGTEIRQVLTREQQARFDQMEAQWEAKRKRVRDRWGIADGA